MHALEEQKSILDDRDCYFIPPYRILKSTIFHAEELRKFINTKFIDQNAFDRFLFWIVRIPVEDRIEVFEEAWSDLNPYNENCWQPFREVVISADRCFNVLKALYNSNVDPCVLNQRDKAEVEFQTSRPLARLALKVYYEIGDYLFSKHIRLVYHFLHRFVECAVYKFKTPTFKSLEEIIIRKKRKIKKNCERIDDEEFIPKSFQENELTVMKDFQTASDKEKIEILKKLSLNPQTCFSIFKYAKLYECSKSFISSNPDEIFEIFSNSIAQSHSNERCFQEVTVAIETLIMDIEHFFAVTITCLSLSQCRLLSNCCFVSDMFGCCTEFVLPILYDDINMNYKPEDNIFPSLIMLKTVACFATIPNLRNGMHCLGFSGLCNRLCSDLGAPDNIRKMAKTCSEWLGNFEVERFFFKSKFNECEHISFNDKKKMFKVDFDILWHHKLPLENPTRLRKMFPFFMEKFIMVPPDGHGDCKLIFTEKIHSKKYEVCTILFNVCKESLSGVLFHTLNTMNELELFMHSHIQVFNIRTERIIPFTHIRTLGACLLLRILIAKTEIVRKLDDLEQKIIERLKSNIEYEETSFIEEINVCSLYELILLLSFPEEKIPKHFIEDEETPDYEYYRQIMSTPFFGDFHFSQGDQDEFGFQKSYERNMVARRHIWDQAPTPTLNVMDWVINMCKVVDVIPLARKYLLNLFSFTALFLQCNSNFKISNNMFGYLHKWAKYEIDAVEVPFVRAMVERSLYFTGVDILTDECLNIQLKCFGLLKVTAIIVEDTQSCISIKYAPRKKTFESISRTLFYWLVSRKLKNKKMPNKELFLKRGIIKLMKIPELTKQSASKILELIEEKYLQYLAKVWKDINKSYLDQLTDDSLSIVTPADENLKRALQSNKKSEQLLKEEKKPLPKIFSSHSPTCSFCGLATINLKMCGRCGKVTYCSSNCQKLDWNTHKLTCKKLSKK